MKINLLPTIGLALLLLLLANPIFAQELEVSLKGKEIKTGVEISWEIPEDHEVSKCILERSVHDTGFKPLKTYDIESMDDLSITYLDHQMGMEEVAYRLRFADEDESIFFSKNIKINKKVVNTFRIAEQVLLPQGVFKVTLECITQGDLEFILLNENGEKVLKENWTADFGLNDFFIDLDYFRDGSYSAFVKKGKEYQSLNFNKTTRLTDEVAMKSSKWKE